MKLKICSSCQKECYLWKSNPKLCKDCALKAATPIGNYKITTKNAIEEMKPYVEEIAKQQFRIQTIINTSKPRTPIKPISTKQAKINAAYKVLNKAFMERNQYCVARFEGICTHKATELHHAIFGSNKRKHYLDETTFRAVCSQCHRHIHDRMNSEELIKLGLRILD